MKRMVKNGDRIDVEPDGDLVIAGNAQVDGRLQVNSSIIANGEIRGGNISGTKFLLGTEEMPLVKANPTGEATGTLEKIKIGNVSYKVGGGGSNDREISLTMPYPSSSGQSNKKLILDEETWNNINNLYYETIKLYYNDGNPIGIFHVFKYEDSWNGIGKNGYYASISFPKTVSQYNAWYGSFIRTYNFASIELESDEHGKSIHLKSQGGGDFPQLNQSNFDALYKLADKPTQDGTYVLKATVSGGAVTYTWEPQA